MLEYDRIDISEGIDINKTNASKESDICHHWYFLSKNFNYEPYLCNGYFGLMQKAMNLIWSNEFESNDIAIISVKGSDHRSHFWYMSKDDAISIMNNSNLSEQSGLLYIFYIIYKKQWKNLLLKKQRNNTK